ncbi:unnamed protein product [Ectocarpus sp. 12 AP-2014]
MPGTHAFAFAERPRRFIRSMLMWVCCQEGRALLKAHTLLLLLRCPRHDLFFFCTSASSESECETCDAAWSSTARRGLRKTGASWKGFPFGERLQRTG